MHYENANEVLPQQLLKEVQKYVSGILLYIPAKSENKTWGEKSGYRRELRRRNQLIINSFQYGESICQLSEDFYLSEDTVRKIVYSKKNSEQLVFQPTYESAQEYSDAGILETWVYTYMMFERRHLRFAENLRITQQHYFGPFILPSNIAQRNTGPEKEMRWRISRAVFEKEIAQWEQRILEKEELPPVLIGYENGTFTANWHNAFLEALHRSGKAEHSFIVRVDKDNLQRFKTDYTELCRV